MPSSLPPLIRPPLSRSRPPASPLAAWLVGVAIWVRGGDRRAWWRMLPALVPVLLFVPMVLAPPLNHDVAAVLDFSQRWLAGERLYSDLIDVNPPLVYVLNLLPAAIARVTPLDGIAALELCLLAWGACAWWLSVRVRSRYDEGAAERAFLDVLPGLFLFAGGYDYGQREHLMAVAALPYVLAAARRAGGARSRWFVPASLFAALGFALKPHFLAVPALVEAVVWLCRLRAGWRAGCSRTVRDPVPWAMAGLWLAYLAALPLLFPDYLEVVVPLVWDFYLQLGGLNLAQVLLVPRMACAVAVLAAGLCMATRMRPRAESRGGVLHWTLSAAALGALASAVAQHKGWSYHIVPIEHFALALAAVLAARWLDDVGAVPTLARAGRVAAALSAGFALYVVSNGEAPWKEIDAPSGPVAGLTALLKQEAAGERVLVLSPGIYPIFPAMNYAHARMTLRSMNMWLLEGAYATCLPDGRRYREVWEMGRTEFFVYRTVAEDFARAPPAAVLVDRQPGIPWCGSEFDFLAYFGRHQLFAEVFSHYRLAAEWDRYRLYTRRD